MLYKHTEKGAADVVVEQHEYARDLVSDKFQEARDYTDQSWELLQDSVDELKNAVNSFDGEEIEIEESSVDTEDITADVDADTKTIEFRDVMNKIDEVLEKNITEGYFDEFVIDCYRCEIVDAMTEFGRICFEAGRTYHLHNTYKYDNYEDFLKEIEDEEGN